MALGRRIVDVPVMFENRASRQVATGVGNQGLSHSGNSGLHNLSNEWQEIGTKGVESSFA
jgi:hypothetical protein